MTDRELVALVAEHVMKWTVKRYPFAWEAQMEAGGWKTIWDAMADPADWDPLHDWNNMRDVVEKMNERYHWRLQSPFTAGNLWWAGLTPHGMTGFNGRPDVQRGDASPARAICLAALAM